MIWDSVRGQAGAIGQLRRSVTAGRLAHALLFVGPPGVGKGRVARLLAMCLFCERFSESQLDACGECGSCRMMLAGTHPDFLHVARPEGKSELPIELLVGSRENRGREGLCHDLALRPMAAQRRVAIIEDADRMSTECANALLKTLEEPPPYAVLILIASDSAALLPTIRSRSQVLRFAPLPAPIVAELVGELDWAENPAEARAAAELCGGSLDVARQLLNPQLRAVRSALLESFGQPRFQPHAVAQAALAALDEIGGETQQQRVNAQWIVHFMVDILRGTLRQWCANGNLPAGSREAARLLERLPASEPETAEAIGEAIDRCVDAEQQLASNGSIPLCLESLVSDLATILESAPKR
jgi:DNA polymerase-3 subunit delta'